MKMVCLYTGMFNLQYDGEEASTVMLSDSVFDALKIDSDPNEYLDDVLKTSMKYLLDEGFESGYNLPFEILNGRNVDKN